MTRFEKDKNKIMEGFDAVEILRKRKDEICAILDKTKTEKNSFRYKCLIQEYNRLTNEYNELCNLI